MERHQEFIKKFREVEYSEKLKKAARERRSVVKSQNYEEGDEVFYQEKDKIAWLGPVRFFVREDKKFIIY